MDLVSKKYLIIPTSITSSIDFDEIYETSLDTLRVSLDGLHTFIKYDSGSRPSIYNSDYSEYSYNEVVNILTGSNWSSTSNPV